MNALKRNEGIASLWVSVMLVMFIAFIGLAIDTGFMVWVGQRLQIAADASALAGATYVRSDEVMSRDAAVNVALANTAAADPVQLRRNDPNDPLGDIVLGRFDRDTGTFDPDSVFRNAVLVNARRSGDSLGGPIDLIFGSIFNIPTTPIGRQAIAMIGGGTGTGMLILDSDADCALEIRGDPTLDVGDGAIQVNSINPCAVCIQGSPVVEASEINSVGDFCITGNAATVPDLYPEQDIILDPLADLPDPVYDETIDLGIIDGPQAGPYQPGYYSGGIDLTGGDIVLDPGIYILDGAGLDVGGNTIFTAEGVMFFIIGTGSINLGGTGELTITPPDPDLYNYPDVDTYEGVAVFQDRENENEGTVLGTAGMNLEGTYYFPKNKVNLGGDSNNFGNQFIAWQAEIFGNGTITLAADGTIPAPGRRVFLVR